VDLPGQPARRLRRGTGRWLVTRSVVFVVAVSSVVGPSIAGSGSASADPLPSTTEAWLYPSSPGQPACDTPAELAALAASPIAVLKPEYLNVSGRGRVVTETAVELPCNGYSAANLASVRAAAQRVLVTVSAGTAGTKALLARASRRSAAVSAIEAFVVSNRLNGVDLDFEPTRWSETMWGAYVGFVSALAGGLGPLGGTVEVDLEPFTSTPWDAQRYGDVATAGGHVVVMAYDHEFDTACAPISPYSWLRQVVAYAQSQVPAADLTIGLPAYGYTTTTCRKVAHVTSNVAYTTMENEPGFPSTPAAVTAQRDPSSGEVRWSSGSTFYDYVDATALDAKLAVVESMGVTDVSVWSLGGEPWFTGNPG
jgi:spore germination protein YaaH